MHYQMLQVLSQKGRHIESYQHRMQHTLVNINIVTIAIIITIISSSTCHSQMSWFQNTCSWSCFTSLFQSSFEAPTLPKSSFTNFRGKKKAKKVPVSLLPHKMATCLKQKKSTQLTPPLLFSVCNQISPFFKPLKSKTSRPMAAGPGVGGNCSFPKDSDSPWGFQRIDRRQGAKGFGWWLPLFGN